MSLQIHTWDKEIWVRTCLALSLYLRGLWYYCKYPEVGKRVLLLGKRVLFWTWHLTPKDRPDCVVINGIFRQARANPGSNSDCSETLQSSMEMTNPTSQAVTTIIRPFPCQGKNQRDGNNNEPTTFQSAFCESFSCLFQLPPFFFLRKAAGWSRHSPCSSHSALSASTWPPSS